MINKNKLVSCLTEMLTQCKRFDELMAIQNMEELEKVKQKNILNTQFLNLMKEHKEIIFLTFMLKEIRNEKIHPIKHFLNMLEFQWLWHFSRKKIIIDGSYEDTQITVVLHSFQVKVPIADVISLLKERSDAPCLSIKEFRSGGYRFWEQPNSKDYQVAINEILTYVKLLDEPINEASEIGTRIFNLLNNYKKYARTYFPNEPILSI